MLQQLRTGAKSVVIKTFLFGLLVLATLGLALFTGHDFSTSAAHKSYVAKIDGSKLSTMQFDRMVQEAAAQQNISRKDAARMGLPQMVLLQEVNTRLFTSEARDAGLLIDDATAARHIKTLISPLTGKGMSEKDALKQFLRAYGMTEGQLVSSVKAQLANDMLLRVISEGVTPAQQMLDDAMKYRYEARSGAYFTLTEADAGKIAEPTDEEIEQTYNASKSIFMQPEYRSFSAIVLTPKALGVEAKVTEEDMREYYKYHPDEFGGSETRAIRQVIVKDEDTAKKLAEGGLKGAKDVKVSSGTYAEGDLPAELAAPVFKAEKAGDKIAPVKSAFGWHVIELDKINKSAGKTFENAKAEIQKKLQQSKTAEAVYAKADDIDGKLAGGKPLSEVADELGLKTQHFDKVAADQKDSVKLPLAGKVLTNVFALSKGEATQLIETPEGEFIIAEVNDILPAAPKPLEAVRADVVRIWRQQKVAEALSAKAAELLQTIKGGETFEKVAANHGKKVTSTSMIKRGDKIDSLSAPMQKSLFAITAPGDVVTVPGENSLSLLRLADRRVDMPQEVKKEDLQGMRQILKQSLQRDIVSQYRQALMKKYDTVINEDVVSSLYDPKNEENQP